jgi:hypothetical protein
MSVRIEGMKDLYITNFNFLSLEIEINTVQKLYRKQNTFYVVSSQI